MAVQRPAAQPRKMFPAPQHPRLAQSRQKLPRIPHHLAGISRHRPRPQRLARRLQPQVQTRRKIGVEPQRAQLPADQQLRACDTAPPNPSPPRPQPTESAPPHRETGLPSRLPCPRSGTAAPSASFCTSRRSACVCAASSIFRLNRITPPGRSVAEHVAQPRRHLQCRRSP